MAKQDKNPQISDEARDELKELSKEELEAQDGSELPKREQMSTVVGLPVSAPPALPPTQIDHPEGFNPQA